MSVYDLFIGDPITTVLETPFNCFHLGEKVTPVSNTFSLLVVDCSYRGQNLKNLALNFAPPQSTILQAYCLPYDGRQTVGSVTVPIQNPVYNFVLTGGLTGCTVIVTKPAGNTVFQVYHDPRSGPPQPTYAGNPVVFWYGPEKYFEEIGDRVAFGSAFLYHDPYGNWSGIGQSMWIDPHTLNAYAARGNPVVVSLN